MPLCPFSTKDRGRNRPVKTKKYSSPNGPRTSRKWLEITGTEAFGGA
jgi:hypothetical protein